MFKIPDSAVNEVFEKLNAKGKTIIFGGYIRDLLLGHKPLDVDISTDLSKEEIWGIFPYANHRVNALNFDIFSFKKRGFEFEISINKQKNILDKTITSDLTINSLIYDGEKLHDSFDGLKDLENKNLNPINDFYKKTIYDTPYSYIRPFRFSSKYDFKIQEDLLNDLFEHREVFTKISENIKNLEGHKIIFSENPILAFDYLIKTQIIKNDFYVKTNHNKTVKFEGMPHLQLTYLSQLTSKDFIFEYMDTFCFSGKIKEKVKELVYLLENDIKPHNFKKLNEIILLRSKLNLLK